MADRATASDISVIGQGARIEGTLVAAGSLRIDGHVKGHIEVGGDVSLSGESVVEADIRAGSISLAGRVKGNLVSPGDVSLPSRSRVEGDVQAQSVTVHGAVKGNIMARDRVELGPGARVSGDISSRRLVVADGAVFRGRSIMGESRPEGSSTG